MKRKILCLLMTGLTTTFVAGCSAGVPLGWGSGANPFSSSNGNSSFGSTVSNSFQKLKEGITAPFSSDPKTSDPISLSTKTPKLGADVYTSAAALFEAQGNMSGAAEQYRLAVQTAPNDPNVLLALARFQDRQNKYDEAIKTYGQVTQANPNNATAFNDLGLCHAKQGKSDAAIEALRRATQLQPNNSLYRNNLARILVQTNRVDEAYNELAAVRSPAHAHYNLGFLLQEKGDFEQAKHHFTTALQTDPNLVQARQMLDRIQTETGNAQQQISQYAQKGQHLLHQYGQSGQQLLNQYSQQGQQYVSQYAQQGQQGVTQFAQQGQQSADQAMRQGQAAANATWQRAQEATQPYAPPAQ